MSNFIQNSGIPLYQSYYGASLDNEYFLPQIVKRRSKYSGMSTLISTLNTRPILVPKTQIIQSFDDIDAVTGQSNGVSLSGNNSIATVTLANNGNQYEFIPKYHVRDNETQTVAEVVSSTSAEVTLLWISSETQGVNGFTSSDFATGNTFVQTSVAKGLDYDKARETGSQKWLPKQRIIQLETVAKSLRLTKGEMFEFNHLSILKTKGGMEFLAYYQEEKLAEMFKTGIEENALYSTQVLEQRGSKKGVAGSIPWQIKNEDGYWHQMTATPSEQDLKAIIERTRDIKGEDGNLLLMAGSKFQAAIDTGLANKWLTTAGTNNTFGGKEIKGLNFTNYQYLGIKLDFMNYNGWNHPQFNNRISTITGDQFSQNSCLCIDESMVDTEHGMLPFASQYCQGTESDTQKGGTYSVIEDGLIDRMGNTKANPISTVPSVGFLFTSTMATVLNDPTRHSLAELAS